MEGGVALLAGDREATGRQSDLPVEVVVFTLDGRRCAIDLRAVERVVPIVAVTPLPGAPPIVAGAVTVHGDVVAVLDLRGRLGLPARDPAPESCLVLARLPRLVVALPADEVLGVHRDVANVDLAALLTQAEEEQLAPALSGADG